MGGKRLLSMSLAAILTVPVVAGSVEAKPGPKKPSHEVDLRIMGTSDLHTHLMNYDYYKDAESNEFGLVKTATLIREARAEADNSLLFDNGDLIQGNPLGDYFGKVNPIEEGDVHPVFAAMEELDYDAATPGNHEFNYGLDYLDEALDDASFPYVSANVFKDDGKKNNEYYFEPYTIMKKKVTDEKGRKQTLKIGVTGVVTPQIMQWDKSYLEGEVVTKDIVQSVENVIPKMKKAGADVIIVLSHSGIGDAAYTEMEENATYDLTRVDGIDAIITGHNHLTFPGDFSDLPGVDQEKGTINGVPVVMPGNWGNKLGVIDLSLEKKKGKWSVADAQSSVRSILENGTPVKSDPAVKAAIQDAHEQTVEYVRQPVGTTTADINSYFALVQDDPSIQIVTDAQRHYAKKQLQGTADENIPVLSAGAPFKAGGRNGASYYTYIPQGEIAIKNVSDLYLYPNTVATVKVTGADVKEWLEMSAGQFNQIDPAGPASQPLINANFPTYNFDVIDGVTYEIDVTQPAKYDRDGNTVNAGASRIKNLSYEGSPIDPDQTFIVVTNNYRASGNFPGVRNSTAVENYPDENRQAIINYITEEGTIDPSADGNWTFAPTQGTAAATFESSPEAAQFLPGNGTINYQGPASNGFGTFTIQLP